MPRSKRSKRSVLINGKNLIVSLGYHSNYQKIVMSNSEKYYLNNK